MFDIGWPELMLIAVITILVVGPKELPRVLRNFTMWIRRLREIASDFQSGLDDLAREAELDEIKKDLAENTPDHLLEDVETSIRSDLDMEEEFESLTDAMEDPASALEPKAESEDKKSKPKIESDG